MLRAPSSHRQGSTTLALLLIFSIFIVIGFMVIERFGETVVARKGLYATEAAARTGLYLNRPAAYVPPILESVRTDGELLAIMEQVALVNGMYPELYPALQASNLTRNAQSIRLRIWPLDSEIPSQSTLVYGIPAHTISEGRHWLTGSGEVEQALGCLPVGIQIAAVPDLASTAPFVLEFGENTSPATVIQWTGSASPEAHVRYLGFSAGGMPEGLPPPQLSVGNSVTPLNASPGDIAELQARFDGRLAIVPLLNGADVVRFARVRLGELVTGPPHTLTLALAPSAAERSALAPPPPPGGPAPLPGDVDPVGLVLHLWRDV